MRQNAGRASSLLRSMANETRLMILCRLSQGEATVGELTAASGLTQSALSQHLAILRRDGLVTTRRQAQFVWYSLASDDAQSVLEVLYQRFCATPADRPGD